MQKFRKAYDKLKDSTKDLDIAIVKATNHVESPPKERHIARIVVATSITCPRADVAYCIHALSRRLSKTRNWIVVIKTLIVIHRVLREGDPSFRVELLRCSQRGHIFQLSNFKDDSSHLAWDCSAWVRTYALFLEERLECFRTLKNDIEVHCRTRHLNGEELLEQLPALQQLLYHLTGCQEITTLAPEGGACYNYLVQYALALVLKESFKIYCAINDGIINIVDVFFEMSKQDAIKALSIYKRAGQQPPVSFLATMEEYIRKAPQTGSMPNKRLKPEKPEEPFSEVSEKKVEEAKNSKVKQAEAQEEKLPKKEEETPSLISREEPADLLGLNQLDPRVAELEENNALALAIVPPGKENPSANCQASETGKTSGWELALLTTPNAMRKSSSFLADEFLEYILIFCKRTATRPSNNRSKITPDKKLAGGFNKLLLDSLYKDDAARRQIQMQQAGYSTGYGYEMPGQSSVNHDDPFAMSNHIAPPTSVQIMMAQQQQQQQQHQQMMQQQPMMQQQNMMLQQQRPQQNMLTVHHQYQGQYSQQAWYIGYSNPSGDPFGYPQRAMPPQGNHPLI
ncbi:hypothetical protein K7X08_027927 [Anisodus acutangulus]|uniref:ENTH domain-containing protein n=1 Tax=Anisodus acutangulus TaxID=402998 RepID=A0A9Q1RR58_9SOLA|nr:hypothetical protein K7X08_027927 [Anisodus acutangulus]